MHIVYNLFDILSFEFSRVSPYKEFVYAFRLSPSSKNETPQSRYESCIFHGIFHHDD